MNPITALLTALGALTVVFIGGWGKAAMGSQGRGAAPPAAHPATDLGLPSLLQIAIGAVTNFFDALGIGSFATTTAAFRFLKMVPDRVTPGTLNAGHALPTIAQAFIFTKLIPVDILTLFSMIAAAVAGAWLGAGVVAHWPKRYVQIGMGFALLGFAALAFMTQLQLFPGGG